MTPWYVVTMSYGPCEDYGLQRCLAQVHGPYTYEEAETKAKALGDGWAPHILAGVTDS